MQIRNTEVDDKLGHTWTTIHDEVVYLHSKWILFTQLYRKGEERITIMEKSASFFFEIIEEMFLDEIVLSISRLTDPPTSSKSNNNLSLPCLLSFLDSGKQPDLLLKLKSLNEKIINKVARFRMQRNKSIAHLDSKICLEGKPELMNVFSSDAIEEALSSIRAFLWSFENFIFGQTTCYDKPFIDGNGEDLIKVLEKGSIDQENID